MDWRYLLSSLLLLPLMTRTLNGSGLRAVLAKFQPAAPQQQPPSTTQIAEARRIARMVQLAATHGPGHASCLVRSLVLIRLLLKRDIPCELEIGGALTDIPNGVFKAHAWVRCGSEVVNDDVQNTIQYKPFPQSSSWPHL